MVFAKITALTALLALGHCFKIPSGLPNGVYVHTVDENGAHNHTRIADISSVSEGFGNIATAALQARGPRHGGAVLESRDPPNTDIICHTAILNRNDVLLASTNLGIACDNGGNDFIKSHSDRYTLVDNVVAYTCSSASASQHCQSSQIATDFNHIMSKCGNGIAGMNPDK